MTRECANARPILTRRRRCIMTPHIRALVVATHARDARRARERLADAMRVTRDATSRATRRGGVARWMDDRERG